MIIDKYKDALANMPASGGGGAHVAMLGIANLGVMASLSDAEITDDIRGALSGTRKVPTNEIQAAVDRARRDYVPNNESGEIKPYVHPKLSTIKHRPIDGKKRMEKYYKKAQDLYGKFSLAELWEKSPCRLSDKIENDAELLFDVLYEPNDVLFIGTQYDKHVKTVAEWLADGSLRDNPYIIPNALLGTKNETASGKMSYRADSCVKDFRFAVVEFDEIDINHQIAFWLTTNLPVCAIIHSGGKSLHGWVKTNVTTREEWDIKIKQDMFDYLIQFGADKACKNPARLSRLPGHFRTKKNHYQQLLYLSPEGIPPCLI